MLDDYRLVPDKQVQLCWLVDSLELSLRSGEESGNLKKAMLMAYVLCWLVRVRW